MYSYGRTDGKLRRIPDMRGTCLSADNSGESDLCWCGVVCPKSVLQCIRNLSRIRDLHSSGNLRRKHMSEFQHMRGVRNMYRVGDV